MTAIKGYNNYKTNTLSSIKDSIKGISAGQTPETLFITCSDSRIMPNQMTDTKHGELFVIRNAGNSVPSQSEVEGMGDSDAATVEYAVKALAVKEIVVCGHSNCGAMGALCSGVDDSLVNIKTYLKRLDPLKSTFTEATTVEEAINENIKYQIDNLMTYDFVKEAVESGKLKLHGWLYNLDSGEVEEIHTVSK